MHTDYMSLNSAADLCNGKRGSVCCKDTARFADRIELFKCLLFDLHVLDRSLYNEVTVAADIFHTSCDLVKDLVSLFLSHFAFCDSLLESSGNLLLSVRCKCFIDVAEHYLIAFCLCECLCNTGTHGSSADNTNFHDFISFMQTYDVDLLIAVQTEQFHLFVFEAVHFSLFEERLHSFLLVLGLEALGEIFLFDRDCVVKVGKITVCQGLL